MPDERAQGAPSITQITELLRQADRLGLTWGRRPGTVVSTMGLFSPRQASVVMDGDDVGITVVSLVGDLAVDDRVMVDRVPPAGQYAVAILDGSDTPMGAAATTNSASIIAETVSLTIVAAELRKGVVYRFEAGSTFIGSSLAPMTYRIRKGATVAGTLWATGPAYPGLGLVGAFAQWFGYIVPTVTMITDVSLTVSSTMTATHVGNSQTPRFVALRRAGLPGNHPQAIPVS